MDENSGPHKRRKVDNSGFSGPDGFVRPKSTSKPKVAVPLFQLAFDTPKSAPNSKNTEVTSVTSKKAAPRSDVGARAKPISRSSASTSSLPHFAVLDPQLQLGLEQNDKPSDKTRRPANLMGPSSAADSSRLPTRVERPISKPTLKPTSRPTLKLKPPIPPSVPPKKPFKPLAIPRPPLAENPAQKSTPGRKTMPLQLQLPLKSPDPPSKTLRTIGTTRIARAIDLSTDNGFAELAGLFLQDHRTEFGLGDGGDPETMRGLDISPKKGSWPGKELRLYRKDGLAAQASLTISRAKTSLALWEKEYDTFFSSRSRSKRPRADARLCIDKIIRQPRKIHSASSAPGLALCRLTSSMTSPPFPLETVSKARASVILPWNEPSQTTENTPISPSFFVLFSFNANPSPSSTPVRNSADFKEGCEFWVWKPWHSVTLAPAQLGSLLELAGASSSLENASEEAVEMGETSNAAWKPKPEETERTVLLCDHFVCARV